MALWLKSGKLVDPLNIDFMKVTTQDLAWALAHVNRWGGHCDPPVSVAQHAVACCFAAWPNPRLSLLALHHDDGEAFFGDMCRDLKSRPEMAWYREQEHRATEACIGHFAPEASGINLAAVKDIDTMSLLAERAQCLPPGKEDAGFHPELEPLAFDFGRVETPEYWASVFVVAHYVLKVRLRK